ncbi:mortality factor 4-like protein 1 [Actinia tenebrosa]|uniref:Mortality factor 4-like protein 1 n=1 Tax=Actinia tenebrosa TaxID=6105 RepID=A0A6P8J1D6_ACTTE|nr:mortality factor 4-like protein 1 [Actinia tenebrosa]
MASSVRSNPAPKFVQGETVLCYEPDLTKSRVLYEAKVLEVDLTKDEKGKKVPEYFIHFNGWNKSWDRWVIEDQVLKNSEANKALKAKLHEQACKSKKKRKQQRASTSSEDNIQSTSNNFNAEISSYEAENTDQPKVEIEIPSQLKLRLEDDCYFIKRKKKLIQLPRTPCVEDILEEYYQYYLKTNSESSAHLVKELMDGLKIYFNFTLPTLLLYNFEREQFRQIMQLGPGESASNDSQPSSEQNGSALEEKCGVVSSTTENAKTVDEPTNSPREKEKRILRRRALRSNAAHSDQQTSPASQSGSDNKNQNDTLDQTNPSNVTNNEESQSSMVSSTSSPLHVDNSVSRLSTKRKAKEVEETEPSNKQPSSGLSSSLPLTVALLSASCKVLPSKLYGPEHLLRLFVKFPGLLVKTNMPEVNLSALLDHIDLFLKYLVERSPVLFQDDVYQSFL